MPTSDRAVRNLTMGHVDEFSLSVRLFLRSYRWRRIDPVPCAAMRRPLDRSRLGLVSSAGFVVPGQAPFDETIRGGDWSFREIPLDTDLSTLVESHRSDTFDHRGVQRDPNLALPLDRARELAAAGMVGELNHRHYSFMGSISATGRFVKHTVPQIVSGFVQDEVDVALLVPV